MMSYKILKGAEMLADPSYTERLESFSQQINPKSEEVLEEAAKWRRPSGKPLLRYTVDILTITDTGSTEHLETVEVETRGPSLALLEVLAMHPHGYVSGVQIVGVEECS